MQKLQDNVKKCGKIQKIKKKYFFFAAITSQNISLFKIPKIITIRGLCNSNECVKFTQ